MQIPLSNVINYMKIKVVVLNFFLKNKKIILPFFAILFFISLYFLIDFSSQSLVAHDEGLYARRARLTESSANWFSPPFISPHHKTVGSYWFIALSIRLFGNSELAVRLPSILSSFLCLITSYLIALKTTNSKSALISLFSLSSMPLWIQYSRYASPDLPFVLCILLVILFFLKSLDSSKYISQYLNLFCSGLFISSSFFIRSYMAFVPFIGLTPFIFYHLFRKKFTFKLFFCTGIAVGFIPTFLNLYFSFQKFGISGITSLFDFAKKQALGEVSFNNLLLVPVNFLYLTFPIGILLLFLFVFTGSNNKAKYPLLIYCYPLLSLILLLCMSRSYPHYYLFLLPSLSIIFANYLTSNSPRYSFSSSIISYLVFILLLILSSVLLFSILRFSDQVLLYSRGNPLIVYILISLIVLSYITSLRFLFDIKYPNSNIINFFYNIIIPQYISLSLLFNFGVLGNPNLNTKLFLKDADVSSIINSNTIYLFSVDSKIQTLLSYYLPSSVIVDEFEVISKYKYVITSNANSLEKLKYKQIFVPVKKFDNHLLLMNIDS
ncbi:putative 4-amino-4-deoxy-L-arabinose transferase and related glycosyltransferases of PMT family [Prochlorococcus marinus str. NATL2A]|uniref:4-amino-4-deoxy-L-arabinose transferase and related glycosyltransferases of PMT family n=1 Tax=Prochlorococcus marinus (strain NATL2A) TaxID=59920 RepID=Q46L50_PROMT|nr:glycosyltransferase family 39 protein [Prochlorococcus marinus]AAZ57778.1 putative 4-amino-4-deoxy-L-arabinose transferase and related glycosyltransferases of PMT family [Prochlorococcus marinus str. NATL2A]